MATLAELGLDIRIDGKPNEIADADPLPRGPHARLL